MIQIKTMAGASLLTLLDDIASLLDDIAVMTKVAVKKTAGVLGDDMALNAEQVAGVHAERELPVIWAVAMGSLKNKAVLVPAALIISAFIPWAVMPLLMLGGLYLCYEGAEKLAHRWFVKPNRNSQQAPASEVLVPPHFQNASFESDKVKGAIRTDFVLSAEIIIIALGSVANRPFLTQAMVLVAVGFVMTIGVYGFVAGIVKLDDVGIFLLAKKQSWRQTLGKALLFIAPAIMKLLTAAGTVAMFLVGGGILTHGVETLQHTLENALAGIEPMTAMAVALVQAGIGVLSGFILLGIFRLIRKLHPRFAQRSH